MNLPPSNAPAVLSATELELLNCLIAAPNQEIAAEWLGCSPTHLRRLLKDLRNRFVVDTNAQLIVLASVSGAIDPAKVLPFRPLGPVPPTRRRAGTAPGSPGERATDRGNEAAFTAAARNHRRGLPSRVNGG